MRLSQVLHLCCMMMGCSPVEKVTVLDFSQRPWDYPIETFKESGFDITVIRTEDGNNEYMVKAQNVTFRIAEHTFVADFRTYVYENRISDFFYLSGIEPRSVKQKLFLSESGCSEEFALKDSSGFVRINPEMQIISIESDSTDEVCIVSFAR